MMRAGWKSLLIAGTAPALLACGSFDDPTLQHDFDPSAAEPPPEKAFVESSATRNLHWGDLHVHTSYSFDAYTMGVRALPDDAYTFMKGGTIEHALGYPIRARRPLDFGAVTDHAEYLAIPRHLGGGGQEPDIELRAALQSGSRLRTTWVFLSRALLEMSDRETREETFGIEGLDHVSRSAWQEIIAAAERHNDPGRFTTFICLLYTSPSPRDRG